MGRSSLVFLALLGCFAAPAYSGEIEEAEATRLRGEMVKLSERAAWNGVEESYGALTELGVELGYDDHFLAAQAARSLGNVKAVRTRLLLANAARENQDVMDWLGAIGAQFGEVELRSGPGDELAIEQQPFAADQRAAVEFAARVVADERAFAGYLPVGRYTLGGQSFDVLPRMDVLQIDSRRSRPAEESEGPGADAEAGETPASKSTRATSVADSSDDRKAFAVYGGAGTSYGWMGLGSTLHFGAVGLRGAVGYDPIYGIISGQGGLRAYPVSTIDLGPASLAPMLELAFAPLRWKEVGVALYGPAISVGAELSVSGVALDFQVGGGVTRDGVRGLTRPGLLTGVGLGYRFR